MYAGRVACCPLVSHVDCAPRGLLSVEKKTVQTDGRTPDRYIMLSARRGKNRYCLITVFLLLINLPHISHLSHYSVLLTALQSITNHFSLFHSSQPSPLNHKLNYFTYLVTLSCSAGTAFVFQNPTAPSGLNGFCCL